LLARPPTVTTTGPEIAGAGTVVMICVLFQLVGVATTPLKVTVLVPWLPPNELPVIVTGVPLEPEGGEMFVIPVVTMKFRGLLGTPFTVTTTGPLVAPPGTVVAIALEFQEVAVATTPVNVTVLVP